MAFKPGDKVMAPLMPEAVEGLAWVVAEARQYQREQCGD